MCAKEKAMLLLCTWSVVSEVTLTPPSVTQGQSCLFTTMERNGICWSHFRVNIFFRLVVLCLIQ